LRGPGIYRPKRNGHCPKFLRFQRSDLYVIKGGHKVGSNLCGFLFGYGIGRILFTGLKDVFQSAAIFRCASVSKQFDRQRRKGQQEGD
jgi:hypothetical protein